ncbi:endonuclease domain-containing protein [Arthrobacter sp. Z1-9]
MRKQEFLPPPLAEAPFTFGSARASGVTLDRLRRKDVVNVGRGLYRPADWDFDLEGAARALSAASPGAWISHVTAARLRCQLLPPWLANSTELHLSKPRALPSVRRKGIFGHTVLALEDEIEVVDGINLSTRSRTWLDLARVLPLNDLVSMGDELIRIPRVDFEGRTQPYDTLAGLRTLVGRHPNLQGIVRARDALDLMRVGADSAPESLLRLAIVSAGLPEPELQVPLRAGDARSPSADLGYRHRRLAIQYDGGHHLGDAQILSDRRRDKAFKSAGWTVLVFHKDDFADGFEGAVQRVKCALRRGWLDHPQASGFASGN